MTLRLRFTTTIFLLCCLPPSEAQDREKDRSVSSPDGTDTPDEGTEPDGSQDGAPDKLDRIVIIGRRLPDRVFDVPGSVDVLDGTEIQREKAFRTLQDAVREIPGVRILSPTHPALTSATTVWEIEGIEPQALQAPQRGRDACEQPVRHAARVGQLEYEQWHGRQTQGCAR